MKELVNNFSQYINTENIAFLSLIVTILAYLLSRQLELKYKKHEDKKNQYIKLIAILQKMHLSVKSQNEQDVTPDKETISQFFDVGSSLLLYGSNKLYRQYLFFRDFSNNKLIQQCLYYKDDLIIYILAEMLKTIRKEVGLNTFNNINMNEAISFFVNDIYNNPIYLRKSYESKFRIKMIKIELFVINQIKCSIFIRIKYEIVKPIFSMLHVLFKYIFIIPLGQIIIKLTSKNSDKRKDIAN